MGTFLVSLSMLMFEILLTRIFTVTMLYHFGFVAISVAMFGITVGALVVYLMPRIFVRERTNYHLAFSALLFSASMLVSFLVYLSIPTIPHMTFQAAFTMGLIYVVISIPFIMGGVCICLILTRFPAQVGKLYAADLAGAAFGCIVTIFFLQVTDGPSAVVMASLIASVGSVLFVENALSRGLTKAVFAWNVFVLVFGLSNAILAAQQRPFLRVTWMMNMLEPHGLYEKWNSFSRIKVVGDPRVPEPVAGWGLSTAYPRDRKIERIFVKIDNNSGTHVQRFDGDLSTMEHLKWEIANLAHYIRPDASVICIGVGGGTDVLSALVFGQKSVVGVDLNSNIIDFVNRVVGNFTGHLDRYPNVKFVHDEARSYIGRQEEQFDIIQGRNIERPTATLGGAFVLSENAVYTVESWKTLLGRLKPNGVLTITRIHWPDHPYEMYRLTSLAREALLEMGVKDPRKHIIVARLLPERGFGTGDDAVPNATILVNRAPFTDEEIRTIEDVCKRMKFEVALSPKSAVDPNFAIIASKEGYNRRDPVFSFVNISPPTDDKPFFYNLLRLRDIFNAQAWEHGGTRNNLKAVFILGSLVATVILLTLLCVVVPLLSRKGEVQLKGTLPFFLYFGAIGLGFMLIEISQMQRLNIFLGHPVYGLSVVLFSLLLSSGIGSYLSQVFQRHGARTVALIPLILAAVFLILFGFVTPYVVDALRSSQNAVRIAATVAMLFPIGIFMGMAFPLGMRLASGKVPDLTPWLWGINGATSVCGSVLAFGIVLFYGISAGFWVGAFCYLVALVSYSLAQRETAPAAA